MNISEDMVNIIKETHPIKLKQFEGPGNTKMIGRNHTGKILLSKDKVTRKEVEEAFNKDVKKVVNLANKLLVDVLPIPQNHFDVFCSLLYDFSSKYIVVSKMYNYYMQGKILEAESTIRLLAKRDGQYYQTLRYRRQIDKEIFSNNKYTTKGIKI